MIGAKKPTASEFEHMARCKVGPCIPCISWMRQGRMDESDIFVGGDYDHKKSGNIRRGHKIGFCSCAWHHRGHPVPGMDHRQTRIKYGPSLTDGSRMFRLAYGTDDELIELQRRILEGEPWAG